MPIYGDSRKLEAACRESVNLMWPSAINYPDHNTINRFRRTNPFRVGARIPSCALGTSIRSAPDTKT